MWPLCGQKIESQHGGWEQCLSRSFPRVPAELPPSAAWQKVKGEDSGDQTHERGAVHEQGSWRGLASSLWTRQW